LSTTNVNHRSVIASTKRRLSSRAALRRKVFRARIKLFLSCEEIVLLLVLQRARSALHASRTERWPS